MVDNVTKEKKTPTEGTFFGRMVVPSAGVRAEEGPGGACLLARDPAQSPLLDSAQDPGLAFVQQECGGRAGGAFRAGSQDDSKLLPGLWGC